MSRETKKNKLVLSPITIWSTANPTVSSAARDQHHLAAKLLLRYLSMPPYSQSLARCVFALVGAFAAGNSHTPHHAFWRRASRVPWQP